MFLPSLSKPSEIIVWTENALRSPFVIDEVIQTEILEHNGFSTSFII
jgi:hypothetical protein